MKETLRRLFLAALEELSLDRVIPSRIRVEGPVLAVDGERIELDPFKKIILVALGKAGVPMARAVQALLEPRLASGVVVSPEEVETPPRYMLHYRGGHPYPNAESVRAAEVILELLRGLKQSHLVIYLLSGGGSAIVEKPIHRSIGLHDLGEFYRLLVTCGAGIVEMNILRKHLSATKGGRMAEVADPARQLTLYVSDVPAGRASTVASGPTMPDESTLEDCRRIVERWQLGERLPASIRALFEGGALPETPKPGHPKFRRSSWHALLSNEHGLEKLAAAGHALGWIVERDLSVDDWPVVDAAERLLARLEGFRQAHPGRAVALLSGGELSSPVTGDGRGGRNQAFALACATRIAGENIAVLSGGTDGIDGNSPACGAVADGETIARAERLGLQADPFYRRSDSYGFFSRLDDAVMTGPTGNNIRDLRMLVAW